MTAAKEDPLDMKCPNDKCIAAVGNMYEAARVALMNAYEPMRPAESLRKDAVNKIEGFKQKMILHEKTIKSTKSLCLQL